MMPFLNLTLATKMQITHFKRLNWGVFELPSEEKELLGVKNAQVTTLWLLAFQNSLCLASTSHCSFQSTALALVIVFTTSSLTNTNPQKSLSNFGSMG
jgi:hypothetical protein